MRHPYLYHVAGRPWVWNGFSHHRPSKNRIVSFRRYILLVSLPGRPSMNPVVHTSTFLGIHNGRLYFQMDDWKYAMPVEELSEEGNLEFGIG